MQTKVGGKSYIKIAQTLHSQMFLYLQQKFNNDLGKCYLAIFFQPYCKQLKKIIFIHLTFKKF